ncbi:MAG: phenylalanine--tRNA ligase beta subunit-related protein [Candidatus Krumholzibacteriia bacterium]|nr:hypothetical protein [Candidatus Latescibacterota bacterium]
MAGAKGCNRSLRAPPAKGSPVDVTLHPELRGRVMAAWFTLSELRHEEAPGFRDEVARVAEGLRQRWAGLKPSEIPLFAPARTLYKAVGMDPTRHRPSSEALLRRILLGKELYRLDAVVDTGNLFSLSHGMPLGLYDADRVAGDVILRLGEPDESFPGIRKAPVNVEARLCLADDQGAFGSPSSDSDRTRIRPETVSGLALLYAPADFAAPALQAAATTLAAEFERWNDATASQPALLGVGEAGD